MSNPIEQFDQLLNNASFLFVVYYRGHWCPFCLSYLKNLRSLKDQIVGAHGNAVIVTAEPAEHLAATRAKTGYGGNAIVDPDNVLAAELKRRGLLNVAISEKAGYAHGMAQPAVLVIQRDGTPLYQWAIMNLKGAKDRPALNEIWENAEAKMLGRPQVHEKYSLQKFATGIWQAVRG
ncbi:hypothetical protein BDR22DRAFT_798508 [Usnea florida]